MLTARKFFNTPRDEVTPAMEEAFFSTIMMRNRTYKTTFHNRFSDVNRLLVQQLSDQSPHALTVLDVGVSSGISTLELFDELSRAGYEARITGTDLFPSAYLVRVGVGKYALVDDEGFPLQFDIGGIGIKPWVVPGDYRNGKFLFRKLINLEFTRRVRRILEQPGDSRIQSVPLISPRLQSNGQIVVCRDDITKHNPAFDARFDLIRVANVMNRSYFSDEALRGIVRNLAKYLATGGGTLLVVRTHDDRANHGTLFRCIEGGRFTIAARFGAGSEVEGIVLEA